MCARLASVLGLGLSLAVRSSAAGLDGATAVLALAEPPGPGADLVELAQQVRSALSAHIPGLLSAEKTRARMVGAGPALPSSRLDEDYLSAIAAFRDGNYAEATAAMRSVVSRVECGAHVGRWSQATMRLASMEDQLGHSEEMRRLIAKALVVDPGMAASPELYRPSFVQKVEEIRRALRATPRFAVTVSAGNARASICIEGHEVGVGTATVALVPGKYRVSAGAVEGIRIPSTEIEVKAEDLTVPLELGLAETLRPDSGPALVSPLSEAPRRIGALRDWLGVGRVILVSLQGAGKDRALVVEEHAGPGDQVSEARLRVAVSTPPPGGVEALAALLASGKSSPLVDLGLLTVEKRMPGRAMAATPTGGRPGPLPPEGKVVIHYHRPDGKYEGWVLHAWESFEKPSELRRPNAPSLWSGRPLPGVTWLKPLGNSSRDDFGAYWLLDEKNFGNGRVNYIIHRGDDKDQCGGEMFWLIRDSKEAWVNAGDCSVYPSKDGALRARKK